MSSTAPPPPLEPDGPEKSDKQILDLEDEEAAAEELQLPRDHYVNTAIKFLLNPRVRGTSLGQKEKFLRQKGLSEDEIQIAFQKSGAYVDEQTNAKNRLLGVVAQDPSSTTAVWFNTIKDVANVIAIFSIGAYGLQKLWTKYIGPKFFGWKSQAVIERDDSLKKLFNVISQLNENVCELKQLSVKLIEHLSDAKYHQQGYRTSSLEFHELKQELVAIKGLLLNRHQFPSSPGIPSWQMVETEEDLTGLDEEQEQQPPSRGRRKDKKSSSSALNLGGKSVETNPAGGDGFGDEEAAEPVSSNSSMSMSMCASASASGRKRSDSNNGLYSGSSCEVVFIGGKHDNDSVRSSSQSHSEPDHSDD